MILSSGPSRRLGGCRRARPEARPAPRSVDLPQNPIVFEIDASILRGSIVSSDRFVFSSYFKPLTLKQLPDEPNSADIKVLEALLQSEIGWLFLDRTRIRPRGWVLGEHLQTLSLAPGEE